MDRDDEQRITVVTGTRNLRTQQFIQSDDQLSTGKQWEEWFEGIEREFRYFRITEAIDKKDAMLIYGGKEIARLEKSLKNEAGEDEYIVLKNKLNKYFLPKKNKHHARYMFLKMKQLRGESIGGYITRLREKANDCEFGDKSDERILEQCIQSIDNKELIRKTISKGWGLDRFVEAAIQMEDTCLQMQEMKIEESHNTVYKIQNNRRQEFKRDEFQQRNRMSRNSTCNYCGFIHDIGTTECPAYGKDCRNCGKRNHFASVCRAGNGQESGTRASQYNGTANLRHRRFVNRTLGNEYSDLDSDVELEQNESEFENDNHFGETVKHIAKIGKVSANVVRRDKDFQKTVVIYVNDLEMDVEPDSGADVNVMDEYQFRNFKKMSSSKPILENSKIELSTLQKSLPVKGEFRTVIRNETRGIETIFVVVEGKINSLPLLSKSTLIDLGMLQIRTDGSFAKQNHLRIPDMKRNARLVTIQDRTRGKVQQRINENDTTRKFLLEKDKVLQTSKQRQIYRHERKHNKETHMYPNRKWGKVKDEVQTDRQDTLLANRQRDRRNIDTRKHFIRYTREYRFNTTEYSFRKNRRNGFPARQTRDDGDWRAPPQDRRGREHGIQIDHPQDRRGLGQRQQIMGPPQDRRGRGQGIQ